MILWRVFPWDEGARPGEPGSALFFPRTFQTSGRHDNRARYGCLYTSVDAASGVAEILAQFRGQPLSEGMLDVDGIRLAIAQLELPDDAELIDLDDPRMLRRERLRPSGVATGDRAATQAYAERLFDKRPDALGLRWWSTLESSWINVTLFDRAARSLGVRGVRPLAAGDDDVGAAARFLGLG